MPVRDIGPFQTNEHQQLVKELATEWQHPQPNAVEPSIAIQRGGDGRPLHVYVAWSRWESIDRTERSEIIMDAAAIALSPEDAYSITIAMGVTLDEATRMGLAS